MARNPGVRTVRVIRKVKVDRLSSTPAVVAPEHDVTGCAVLPRATFEQGRGWTIVEGLQVIAPYGADVLADDQVAYDGETWDVDGKPGDYENRRAVGKATMFYLKRLGT